MKTLGLFLRKMTGSSIARVFYGAVEGQASSRPVCGVEVDRGVAEPVRVSRADSVDQGIRCRWIVSSPLRAYQRILHDLRKSASNPVRSTFQGGTLETRCRWIGQQ